MDIHVRAVRFNRLAARLTWIAAIALLALTACSREGPVHDHPHNSSVLADWSMRTQGAPGSFWLPRSDIVAERCGASSASNAVVDDNHRDQDSATGTPGGRVTCDDPPGVQTQ
jgi:hypothetical protein